MPGLPDVGAALAMFLSGLVAGVSCPSTSQLHPRAVLPYQMAPPHFMLGLLLMTCFYLPHLLTVSAHFHIRVVSCSSSMQFIYVLRPCRRPPQPEDITQDATATNRLLSGGGAHLFIVVRGRLE
jgi:hypothetical protein